MGLGQLGAGAAAAAARDGTGAGLARVAERHVGLRTAFRDEERHQEGHHHRARTEQKGRPRDYSPLQGREKQTHVRTDQQKNSSK